MDNVTVPTSQRQIDSKAAINILNKRSTLKLDHVGSDVKIYVQGTPQFLPKGHTYMVNGQSRENQWDRWIYNVTAQSALAMQENKQLFTDAMKAESIGDTAEAHKLFNEYLNKVQVSFSAISGRKHSNGDALVATVATAINTLGKTVIVIDRARYQAPTIVESGAFSVEDLLAAPAIEPAAK